MSTSSKSKSNKYIKVKNLFFRNINEISKFNTLIIDAEGDEKYYIENLRKLKTIKHLFFELHYNIFNDLEVSKIMKKLKKNRFKLKDKCFNSFILLNTSQQFKFCLLKFNTQFTINIAHVRNFHLNILYNVVQKFDYIYTFLIFFLINF